MSESSELFGIDRGVLIQRLKQIVGVAAIPCGKHAEHELDGGIVYYCPWCECDQLVDEDHPFRFDRMQHLAECPAQWLRHLLDAHAIPAASREQPSEPPPLSDDMKQLMSDASWMIGAIEGDEKATPSQKMRAKRSWLIIKRLAESVASHGPEKAPRNEWRLDERGDLDDVVVEDVATFRLERMGDDHVWGRIYHRDGSQTDFNLHGERLSLTHEHDSPTASHGPDTKEQK